MKTICVLFCFAVSSCALAEPKLSDYPVENNYVCTARELGQTALNSTYEDSRSRMESRLLTKSDFAGHYYLVDLPTPKGGVFTYVVIDCLTGKIVANLDDPYVSFYAHAAGAGHEPRRLPTSRLLIIGGMVDTDHADLKDNYETEYYEMKGGVLSLIKKGPAEIVEVEAESP